MTDSSAPAAPVKRRIELADLGGMRWHQLWSIRVAFFWAVLGGCVALLPLISDEVKGVVGPWAFAAIFLAMFVSVTLARVTKQPGASDG